MSILGPNHFVAKLKRDPVKSEFIAYSRIMALVARAPLHKLPRLKVHVAKAHRRMAALQPQ